MLRADDPLAHRQVAVGRSYPATVPIRTMNGLPRGPGLWRRHKLSIPVALCVCLLTGCRTTASTDAVARRVVGAWLVISVVHLLLAIGRLVVARLFPGYEGEAS